MGAGAGILRRCAASAAAASLVLLGAARGGEGKPAGLIRVITAVPPHVGGFGASIAAAGDVDGDGTPDLLIGATAGDYYLGGAAVVLSGDDGSLLRTMEGPGFPGDDFGAAVASLGDIDGRGTPDFLVGAPGGRTGIPEATQPTYAMAFAGEDGAVLFDSGPMEITRFGQAVAVLPDLDGDGVAEFSVGAGNYLGPNPVALSIYSGATGGLLHAFETTPQDDEGLSLVPLVDMDGDGHPELAVGFPGPYVEGRRAPGRISIRSGATFEEIRSIRGRSRDREFGTRVVPLGPPGGRGAILVAVGSHAGSRRRVILLLDARTGRRLRTIRPSAAGEFFSIVATIGDQDGDGIREIVIRTHADEDRWEYGSEGLIQVYAGGTGRLLFSRRGWNIESFVDGVAPAGDVDGDGRVDLANVAGPLGGEREVRIYRVDLDAGASSVRIAFQRTSPLLPDGLEGDLEVGLAGARQPFHLDVRGLPLTLYHSGDRQVHLEDGPGSGTFVPIGYLHPIDLGNTFPFTYGRWVLDDGIGDIPVSVLRADLSGLAGRRVRVGSATSPVLEAVVPSPFSTDFRGVSRLDPPEGLPPTRVRGWVRVASSIGSGTTTLQVRTKSLANRTGLMAWSEETPGGVSWTLLGELVRGRLTLDTGRGDTLPRRAPNGASLTGLGVEVRDGETVLLRGTMP